MAKIVKKKPAAKAAAKPAKKAAPAKAAKPTAKKAAPAPKAVVKKKAEKAPAKAALKKPEVKKKVEAKAPPAKAVAAKPVKENKAEASKKAPEKKAAAPQPAAEKTPKKEAKPAAGKKGKGKKEKEKEESDLDDAFIGDDDGMGDEIGEYEEELKAVEEADEEESEDVEWTGQEKPQSEEEIILTDAEGRRYCRARDCDQIAAVDVYCRYHYLLFWKKIQVRKKILVDGKLERYVEELTSRYPDKFLEMIRRDLRTEKDFLAAIQELEIDESAQDSEFEEDSSAFIEEVRGMGDNGASGVEDDEY